MTINISKLQDDERRDLNVFLKMYVEKVLKRHTILGKELLDELRSSGNTNLSLMQLPKNLEISLGDLIYEDEFDLAKNLEEEFKSWKFYHKGKSVKFK